LFKKGERNAEIPIPENVEESFSCHDPLLCDPIDFICHTIFYGQFGVMGLLRSNAALPSASHPDDEGK